MMKELFESYIGKLAIPETLKQSIIGIHKICLEAEELTPEDEQKMTDVPAPGDNSEDPAKPIRDVGNQIVNDVNTAFVNHKGNENFDYKTAIIDSVKSKKPKIDECLKLNKNALTAIATIIDRQTKQMAGGNRVTLDELTNALGYQQSKE